MKEGSPKEPPLNWQDRAVAIEADGSWCLVRVFQDVVQVANHVDVKVLYRSCQSNDVGLS